MMDKCRRTYRAIRAMKWLSPGSFLLCAVTFAGFFVLAHVAGWRERTGVFCGTLPKDTGEQVTQGFMAVSYTLLYFATVIVAPILVLAAGVYRGLVAMEQGKACASEQVDK
jgi:hypothetical protein